MLVVEDMSSQLPFMPAACCHGSFPWSTLILLETKAKISSSVIAFSHDALSLKQKSSSCVALQENTSHIGRALLVSSEDSVPGPGQVHICYEHMNEEIAQANRDTSQQSLVCKLEPVSLLLCVT